MTDSHDATEGNKAPAKRVEKTDEIQQSADKPVYEKPKLRKYGQIDHIAAYGAE